MTTSQQTHEKSLILYIEDDPSLLKLVRLSLQEEGYTALLAPDGEEGLRLYEKMRPDLILLGLTLPGIQGLNVLRRIRQESDIPIIILTARTADADKIRGLEMGADDYVGKPFNPDELVSRIRAVLRRARPWPNRNRVRAGDVEIDLTLRKVSRNGERITLTRTQWELMRLFAQNPDRILLHAEILQKVWGPEYVGDLEYLRRNIGELRAKLGETAKTAKIIQTVPDIGYVLEGGWAEDD